jgi:hypothetical protein
MEEFPDRVDNIDRKLEKILDKQTDIKVDLELLKEKTQDLPDLRKRVNRVEKLGMLFAAGAGGTVSYIKGFFIS